VINIKQVISLLNKDQKISGIFLFLLILFSAFLDVLGVASILPFMALLTNPQIIETNELFNFFYVYMSNFGVDNTNHFLFFIGLVVFLLLIMSLFFRAVTLYAQWRFVMICEHLISKTLIKKYLYQPYEWFLNQNSANLGKSILSEVDIVIGSVIMSLLIIFSQSIVVSSIILLLIITNPIIALSAGLIFGISYVSIFYFVKNTLSLLGVERLKANDGRYRTVNEAFGAYKDVKMKELEDIYINKFSDHAKIYAFNRAKSMVIGQFPRFLIEGIAFGGMLLVILVLMGSYNSFDSILPVLSLFAFAGYRLIPSFQQIYYGLTSIKFAKPSFDTIYYDFKNLDTLDEKRKKTPELLFSKKIYIKNLYYKYPGKLKSNLNNINLSIPAFSTIGIAGPSGSGKSTLIGIILGLLKPSSGSLEVDEKVIDSTNIHSWQKIIGYVPQQIYISDSSIASNIAFGIEEKKINHDLVIKAAKSANLHNFIVNDLNDKYETVVGERGIRLSGGQLQRLGIARALYTNPKILVLDEATSSLDNVTEKSVMDSIYNLKNKITIIIIAHRLDTIKNCDNIFLIKDGTLEDQGTYLELTKKSKLLKTLYNFEN
jgi:ABC-type multidrug transport system fused ATPase/permease subunit